MICCGAANITVMVPVASEEFIVITRRDLLVTGVGGAIGAAALKWIQGGIPIQILDTPRAFQTFAFRDSERVVDVSVLGAVHSCLGLRSEMGFSDLLHWVRLYGCKGNSNYQPHEASETIAILTDDSKIEQRYGQSGVIAKTKYGVKYHSRLSNLDLKRNSRPAHPGQAVAILGEIGVAASAPLICSTEQLKVYDAITDSLSDLQVRNARLQEPEWPTQVIAYYAKSPRWRNRWNEEVTLDAWVQFLLERDVASYCCGGTHLLQSLAAMLQANDQARFLGEKTVSRITSACREYSTMLESTQHDDGAWRDDWTTNAEIKGRGPIDVHMTGHILEGQLYLPEDLRISPESAAAALRSLARAFLTVDHEFVWSNYCPFSHAGRVLMICAGAHQTHPGEGHA